MVMRWLPRLEITHTLICMDDGEAEGPLLVLTWGPFVVEVAVARRTRTIV